MSTLHYHPPPVPGAGCTNSSRWCRFRPYTLYCTVLYKCSDDHVRCTHCTLCDPIHWTGLHTVNCLVNQLYSVQCTGAHTVHCTLWNPVHYTLYSAQLHTLHNVQYKILHTIVCTVHRCTHCTLWLCPHRRRSQCAIQSVVQWPFPGPCIVNTGCTLYRLHNL